MVRARAGSPASALGDSLGLLGAKMNPVVDGTNRIEWTGGGSLTPTGAVNPNKVRSLPIRYILRNEDEQCPAPPLTEKEKARIAESFRQYSRQFTAEYDASSNLGRKAFVDKRTDFWNGEYKPIWQLYPYGYQDGWDEAEDAYNDCCAEAQYLDYYERDCPTWGERMAMERDRR